MGKQDGSSKGYRHIDNIIITHDDIASCFPVRFPRIVVLPPAKRFFFFSYFHSVLKLNKLLFADDALDT